MLEMARGLKSVRQVRGGQWLHIVILAGLCFLVYANALAGDFVWDDNVQIVRNESIRSPENIPRAFTSSLWSFLSTNRTSTDSYYRPLQTVIFTLTYYFGGLSPTAYHLVSIGLHIAATVMVYLFFVEFGLSAFASLAAAAVFAVHPIHTEAVSWIAGVGEVACGLLYFAALWSFLRYSILGRGAWLGLSALMFLLALFSKEMAVTLPVAAILLMTMKRDEKCSVKQILFVMTPYAIVFAAYAIIRFTSVGLNPYSAFRNSLTVPDWATLFVWIFGRYLRYAFLPYPLAPFHPAPLLFGDRVVSTSVSVLAIGVVVGMLWYKRRTLPDGFLWLCMFAAMLAPVFYFKGISGGSIFAERYLYIPSLAAIGLMTQIGIRLPRRWAVIAAVAIIGVFSIETVARNRDWKNDRTLFAGNLETYPESISACLNLSAVYIDDGNYEPAQQCLQLAERHIDDPGIIHPQMEKYRFHVESGTLAVRRGRVAEARLHLNKAIEIDPSASDAYTILAGVMMNQEKDFAGAIPILKTAIELSTADDQARDSMGVAHYNLKQYDEAIRYFREALQINPGSERAKQHLETALKRAQQQ